MQFWAGPLTNLWVEVGTLGTDKGLGVRHPLLGTGVRITRVMSARGRRRSTQRRARA